MVEKLIAVVIVISVKAELANNPITQHVLFSSA